MCSVMTRSGLPARLFVVSHLFHHFSASAHFCLFFPPVSLRLHSLTPRQQLTPQCLTPNQSECKPTRSAPPLTPSSPPRVAPDLLQFTEAGRPAELWRRIELLPPSRLRRSSLESIHQSGRPEPFVSRRCGRTSR